MIQPTEQQERFSKVYPFGFPTREYTLIIMTMDRGTAWAVGERSSLLPNMLSNTLDTLEPQLHQLSTTLLGYDTSYKSMTYPTCWSVSSPLYGSSISPAHHWWESRSCISCGKLRRQHPSRTQRTVHSQQKYSPLWRPVFFSIVLSRSLDVHLLFRLCAVQNTMGVKGRGRGAPTPSP
jgi:hypothetical protein